MRITRPDQHGTILLVFIITLPFLITIALYYMTLSLTSAQVARFDQFHTMAQLAADAGADASIEAFSSDNTWTGTNGAVTVHSDSQIKTTYTASLSGNSTAKVLAVTGKTYFPAATTTPKRTVQIYVDLRPVTSGNFSLVSGAGGLTMSNSSKIVGGNVFINGGITLSNSAQIGLSTNSVSVKVAHQSCPSPPDATYPRVCNSGESGQPISTTNPNAHIYGTVTATNQTDGSHMSNPGLVAGSVAPQALPTYDRAAQKAAWSAAGSPTMTAAAASCSGNTTRTWPANTKITGDVTVSNKCKVTVQGNIWITGSLSISNNQTALIVADSLGSTRPNIMVDSVNGITLSNSAGLTTNSSGTGFEFYTFYSTAGCSPDCSSVSGTSLASSRTVPTITVNTGGDAANSIFYAYWSQVNLANSGQIGALIGQTINLSNSGTITFGASVNTSNVTWVVKGYRRQ